MASISLDPADTQRLTGAYDTLAAAYDGRVEGTAWMRDELRRQYLTAFEPGSRTLDVGCGTGTEALFMAQQGMDVFGMDISPRMIEETRRKAAAMGIEGRIHATVADLRELEEWPADSFDGILSTFAGLNMVNSLAGFSAAAAHILRPGGRMVLHMSNRFCIQEYLRLAGRGRWREAHRLSREGVRTFSMSGRPMVIYLSSPGQTYSWFFEPQFELESAHALGVVRPYTDPDWMPGPILSALGQIERVIRQRRWFASRGRFFVLQMVKRSSALDTSRSRAPRA